MDERTNYDHYIAQHYIKRFINDSNIVFIGNIHTRNIESFQDVSRVLGDVNWSVSQEVEDAFSNIEGSVATAFSRLVSDPDSITGLSKATRVGIKDFIKIHHARSTGINNNLNNSTEQLVGVVRNMAPDGVDSSNFSLQPSTRSEALGFGLGVGESLEPVFMTKGCVALIAPPGTNFILGDNPFVTLTTQEEFFMRGAVFSDSTSFWFPLNPRIGLFFTDGIGNKIAEGPIKRAVVSTQVVNALNRAEVFLAVDSIVGNSRGLVRNKLRLPNIGPERSSVQQFGASPIVITQNNAIYGVQQDIIDSIEDKFAPTTT